MTLGHHQFLLTAVGTTAGHRRLGAQAHRVPLVVWVGMQVRTLSGGGGDPLRRPHLVPCTVREVKEFMTSAGPAHVLLERPERPAFLVMLTHGAGGTPDTADILAVRDVARELGAATALVTQPYRVRGARAPGSVPKQDAAWVEVVDRVREETEHGGAGLLVVQCGRSNGARVACRTARHVGAIGVIALAFPLRPPGQPGKSREAELRGAGTSVLVINGERDPFGVPESDEATDVVVLPGEAHALSKHPEAVGVAVKNWLSGLLPLG